MESATKVNGWAQIATDTASSSGPMVPNTKANGKKTKRAAKANSLIPTTTHTMVNGKMTKPMDTAFTSMLDPKPNTKVTGKTI